MAKFQKKHEEQKPVAPVPMEPVVCREKITMGDPSMLAVHLSGGTLTIRDSNTSNVKQVAVTGPVKVEITYQ